MKIVLVEDSELVRRVLKDFLLEIPGVEIISEVSDASEAVQALGFLDPDLVILDIGLRRGTGFGVLKEIRKTGDRPTIVVFTNSPYPQFREICMGAGADYFLDKSAELETLLYLVRQLNDGDALVEVNRQA